MLLRFGRVNSEPALSARLFAAFPDVGKRVVVPAEPGAASRMQEVRGARPELEAALARQEQQGEQIEIEGNAALEGPVELTQ